MNLAPALAARLSGDSSLRTEVALDPHGCAGALRPAPSAAALEVRHADRGALVIGVTN